MPGQVEVAVAIMQRADGSVLLAQRPQGRVYAGYWEFPGGKVEPGEAVVAALAREIGEELGVRIDRAFPWITRVFTYPHARVRLHFFRVPDWRGEPRALEHQALIWQRPQAIDVAPLLPANGAVLKALLLHDEYAISHAAEMGETLFLARLAERFQGGLRFIQVREKGFSRNALDSFARRVVALARPHGARVIVNADAALARSVGADGVHLTARQLARATHRPDLPWCGASCHSAAELRAAERLGADFAVLGPVLGTASHADAAPLGWDGFAAAVADASIPVYALGGLEPGMLDQAREKGAHGIAMIRGSWQTKQ